MHWISNISFSWPRGCRARNITSRNIPFIRYGQYLLDIIWLALSISLPNIWSNYIPVNSIAVICVIELFFQSHLLPNLQRTNNNRQANLPLCLTDTFGFLADTDHPLGVRHEPSKWMSIIQIECEGWATFACLNSCLCELGIMQQRHQSWLTGWKVSPTLFEVLWFYVWPIRERPLTTATVDVHQLQLCLATVTSSAN